MTKLEKIEKKIRKIAPQHFDELDKLVEGLLSKSKRIKRRKMKLSLRGALKNVKYTSVELQHKVKDWVTENTSRSKKS